MHKDAVPLVAGQSPVAQIRLQMESLEKLVRETLLGQSETATEGSVPARMLGVRRDRLQIPASLSRSQLEVRVLRIVERIREASEICQAAVPSPVTTPESLEQRRQARAQELLDRHDFGRALEGHKSWDTTGDIMRVKIFLSGDLRDDLAFSIRFETGSDAPAEFGLDPGETDHSPEFSPI